MVLQWSNLEETTVAVSETACKISSCLISFTNVSITLIRSWNQVPLRVTYSEVFKRCGKRKIFHFSTVAAKSCIDDVFTSTYHGCLAGKKSTRRGSCGWFDDRLRPNLIYPPRTFRNTFRLPLKCNSFCMKNEQYMNPY